MKERMIKEESVLFPAMSGGGDQRIEQTIAMMRNDHNNHAVTITSIKQITPNITSPGHTCGSWRTLYAGITKLLEDLEAHIALENNILFPRFEQD
jgi:regulator of cell morphogenesis and NO signaling